MKNNFNKIVKGILDKRPVAETAGIGLIYQEHVDFKPKPPTQMSAVSWVEQAFHSNFWPRNICSVAIRFRSYGYDSNTNTITITWTDQPSKSDEFMVEDFFNKKIPNAKFKHKFWWNMNSKTSIR